MGEDSRRSSILFGIHSESKALQELERVRRQNRRFSLLAALAIFVLVAALICLIVYDLYANSNRNRPELISPQSWQTTEDVEITPQGSRRWGKEEEEAHLNDEHVIEEKHANHRYGEISEPLEERAGFKPQPFHLPNDGNLSANQVLPPTADFRPPVRFRGIYIHPTQQIDQQQRNQEYYQKINDLFMRPYERNIESLDTTTTENPRSFPAVNDLFTKASFQPRPTIGIRKTSPMNRKPFTVMLDIYPMDKDENGRLVEGQRPKDTIFIPMKQFADPSAASSVQYLPQVMLPPRPKKNRMFMKLNLFPKPRALTAQKRTWNTRQNAVNEEEDYDYEGDEDDEEEEDEEEEGEDEGEEDEDEDMDEGDKHNCNGVVGHNPYGKPISAKWKSKNGEWVHAKYVTLNQWDDRMDPR